MFNKKISALAIAALLAAPAAHATNGYFSHGFGTKSKSMAGGGIALPQEAMIMATNPAGISWVGRRAELGLAIFTPTNRGYDASGGPFFGTNGAGAVGSPGLTSDSDWFFIPSFAYTSGIDDKSSWGVSLYGNGGMNTDYDADQPNGLSPIGTPGVYGAGKTLVDYSQLFVNLTYSRKVSNNVSLGISGIFAAQRIKIKGVSSFAGFSTSPTNLSNNGYDYSYGGGLKLGVQWLMSDTVAFAASYQTKMWMSKFSDYKGLFADSGDMDIPSTATLGVAWKALPQHTFTLDYQYIWYSDTGAISNDMSELSACAVGKTKSCLGGSSGAGFGWDNMGVIKLGYQFEPNEKWQLRAGWSYGEQPINKRDVMFNIMAPATIEHHFTAGLTRKVGKSGEVNLAFMYAPNTKVNGPNYLQNNGLVPPNFHAGVQDIELYMEQYELEINYTWLFD